nr:VWA domain-containing protein [Vibrio crassostreae]
MPPHLVQALNLKESGWKSQLPLKFLAVVSLLAIVIASGVTWKKQPSPFGEDKSSLVIVLDNSASMMVKDLAPSRLKRSKQKIIDLLESRDGGRASLIAYSGTAHVVMPMTEDVEVFKPLLNAVSPMIMPKKGKFAEKAIPLIDATEKSIDQPMTVLLVTDGLGSETAELLSAKFEESKHQLIIWGAGNPKKSSSIAFEELKLKNLASAAGGYYQGITVDNTDVEILISKMEAHMQLSLDDALPWDDAGYYLVFVMAVVFLLWFRKGWLVQWCLVGAVALSSFAPNEALAANFSDLWITKDQQGMLAFKQGNYSEASTLFQDPMWIGLSKYKARDYKAAHEYFMRIDSTEGLFRAANALARSREYVAARSLYDELLKVEPDNLDAQANRALIHRIIEEINQFSESQKNTENDASKELGDKPQTGEGADEMTSKDKMIQEKITADQLLQDESLNEKWMQRVQSNPEVFLSNKFTAQMYKAEGKQ